jgi:hypothetical protein
MRRGIIETQEAEARNNEAIIECERIIAELALFENSVNCTYTNST